MLKRLKAQGFFRVIGLTGNIASGKSHARACLDELGVHTIDADACCHRAYNPGFGAYDLVIDAFGRGVVGPDGKIDRAALGQLVFNDAAALKTLEEAVWPTALELVEDELMAMLALSEFAEVSMELPRYRASAGAPDSEVPYFKYPVGLVEAAVLLKAGWDAEVDEVWATSAQTDVVLARLADRGLAPEEAQVVLFCF